VLRDGGGKFDLEAKSTYNDQHSGRFGQSAGTVCEDQKVLGQPMQNQSEKTKSKHDAQPARVCSQPASLVAPHFLQKHLS